ncbi:MAG: S41 family peptidase [Pseudomonadota bacterium]
MISACGGGSSGDDNGECSIPDQNQFVYELMQEVYLYYDRLPAVNPNAYASPDALLDDLIVSPDRFSYIADQATQDNFFNEGTYIGFGFNWTALSANDIVIAFVFDDSSAGQAGLQRGDRITALGGVSIADLNANSSVSATFNSIGEGESLLVTVLPLGASETTDVVLTNGLVTMNTVISERILTSGSSTVGYMGLTSFLEPTKTELDETFSRFSEANIDELVLDLRYNGGGRLTTAQLLSSLIAGPAADGADTARIEYNDKNTEFNQSFPFLSLVNRVGLNRLYVLTLGGTCSASELTINAMDPVNIEVITVGETTCGKPVGSDGFDFCGKTINPITFAVLNDLGQGDYFDGIAPVCFAEDDLDHDFADTNEGMLATALFHINNGQCPISTRRLRSQHNTVTITDPMQMVQ